MKFHCWVFRLVLVRNTQRLEYPTINFLLGINDNTLRIPYNGVPNDGIPNNEMSSNYIRCNM